MGNDKWKNTLEQLHKCFEKCSSDIAEIGHSAKCNGADDAQLKLLYEYRTEVDALIGDIEEVEAGQESMYTDY